MILRNVVLTARSGFVHSLRRLRHRLRPAAYAEGSPTVALVRNMLIESTVENQKKYGFGDPEKGVQKMWELSKLENPPLRLMLGKDINKHAMEYIAQLTKEMGEYESWSDHLGFEA